MLCDPDIRLMLMVPVTAQGIPITNTAANIKRLPDVSSSR